MNEDQNLEWIRSQIDEMFQGFERDENPFTIPVVGSMILVGVLLTVAVCLAVLIASTT